MTVCVCVCVNRKQEFLNGANNIDDHFKNMPMDQNIPVLMGLLSIWNCSFLGHGSRAILPYCQVSVRDPAQCAQCTRIGRSKLSAHQRAMQTL